MYVVFTPETQEYHSPNGNRYVKKDLKQYNMDNIKYNIISTHCTRLMGKNIVNKL